MPWLLQYFTARRCFAAFCLVFDNRYNIYLQQMIRCCLPSFHLHLSLSRVGSGDPLGEPLRDEGVGDADDDARQDVLDDGRADRVELLKGRMGILNWVQFDH